MSFKDLTIACGIACIVVLCWFAYLYRWLAPNWDQRRARCYGTLTNGGKCDRWIAAAGNPDPWFCPLHIDQRQWWLKDLN